MLQAPFKNYDEFKELFVAKNADGTSRRKNGILLAFYKSKAMRDAIKYGVLRWPAVHSVYDVDSMPDLYTILDRHIRKFGIADVRNRYYDKQGGWYEVRICGLDYASDMYSTDGRDGICVDLSYKKNGEPDYSFYRYRNEKREGRVFKMKVGKMYCHLTEMSTFGRSIPDVVRRWMEEETTRRWEAYYSSKVPSDLVLHVDDDFEAIYDGTHRCDGYFGSCMQMSPVGNSTSEHWQFYSCVPSKAAYLTLGDGPDAPIVARCVIFTKVLRYDTNTYIRVAERQYARENENELMKRLLIEKLKEGGHIDAYKTIGAGCGDASSFVDIDGNDMSNVVLSTEMKLENGGHLAYQDSFKWYSYPDKMAYNHSVFEYTDMLDSTSSYFNSCYEDHEGQNYDSWHDVWVDEDVVTVYSAGDEFTCSEDRLDSFCLVGRGNWEGEYHHEDDCAYCEDIEEYVDRDEATYSDILDEYYYDEDVMREDEQDYKERNWYYSELLDEYYRTLRERDRAETEYKAEYWAYSELLDDYFEDEDALSHAEREYKEEHWYYSSFDDDYFEDEDDVRKYAIAYVGGDFEYGTISFDSFCKLLDSGDIVEDEHSGMIYTKEALEAASHAA